MFFCFSIAEQKAKFAVLGDTEMTGLDAAAVEGFRTLTETKAWDYIVVWKYGDDPTRFIEWMDCCCVGGYRGSNEVKTEEECRLNRRCRDTHYQHPVRTKACEALAQLPYTMPLYSGVHGDVAISKQPQWLTQDSTGTQVLVPITGGIIELFTSEIVAKDSRIIELITARCCLSMMIKEAISEHPPLDAYRPQSLISSLHASAGEQCRSHPSIEGSSSGSNPSNETSKEHQRGLDFQCGGTLEDKPDLVNRPYGEGYTSKNLVTERNRRSRIKDGLYALRALVPKISKMDRASIVADAIDYIKELQGQEKGLRDEMTASEGEDHERNKPQSRRPIVKEQGGTRSSSNCTKRTQTEVQVEVNQIGKREFLVKIHCEKKRGGFAKLMEAIHLFGLQANKLDVHPDKLREYLTKQAGSQERGADVELKKA
ncbi:transcription factor ABORTED MICROSPORES isoform X2 [Prosopis cineraria]|uniref:transcription factor ABORTED MICROSPORES isoform X2 n=1 Tax=Prosopis cineraria TaxID=364024 RepID=UPI00240F66AD|nr:transcription factor ABORTED MICROSPORES isoform X2 [Prosopis cineraria]